MTDQPERVTALSKVPAVTLGFWIIKILATTLGETGGDTRDMSWLGETTDQPVPNGYLIGTAIFGVLLVGWSGRRSGRGGSTRGSTGRRSSPRPPAARRWPTSPTARSASAIPAARCCCSPACCCRCSPGTGRSGPSTSTRSSTPARRDLLLDHDHLLADARHRARRLGRRRRASAIRAARWCSAARWPCSRSCIS